MRSKNQIKALMKGVTEMELRVIHYFLTVAEEGTFSAAAEKLHITQPTLSRQIKGLEEELGTILFMRTGNRLELTKEGILNKKINLYFVRVTKEELLNYFRYFFRLEILKLKIKL